MAYSIKACTNKKYRKSSTVILTIFAILTVFCIVMIVYNIIKNNILFTISYSIAAILCLTYLLIRLNSVFPTYIASDKRNIYMRTWTNEFLPYKADAKIKLFSEFIPAKTKLIEIPIDEIEAVFIGTKNFIKRYAQNNGAFLKAVKPYETTKDYYKKKTVQSMDLIYIETMDGDCYFMPIVNFSSRDVIKIVQFIQRSNINVDVKVNSKHYRALKVRDE